MARSIVRQGFYLQREAVTGTPITDAMKRYLSVKGELGWDIETEEFQASGYSVTTGENILSEMGDGTLEVIQDFNGFLPLLAGWFGEPTTTALEATPTAAYQHVFTLDPQQAADLVTFTAMWGDPVLALQAAAFGINSLGLTVSRKSLNLTASPIFRAPVTGIALPSSGVTEVPMVPVRSAKYDAYIDNSWANLGTTKSLGFYSSTLDFPNRYEPDWLVNSALTSYSELMEVDRLAITQDIAVVYDAAAESLINDARAGGMKFIRLENIGPDINGTDNYGITIDTAVRMKPGRVTRGPEAASVAAEMSGSLQVDGTSGNVCEITLINTLAEV